MSIPNNFILLVDLYLTQRRIKTMARTCSISSIEAEINIKIIF